MIPSLLQIAENVIIIIIIRITNEYSKSQFHLKMNKVKNRFFSFFFFKKSFQFSNLNPFLIFDFDFDFNFKRDLNLCICVLCTKQKFYIYILKKSVILPTELKHQKSSKYTLYAFLSLKCLFIKKGR